MSSNVYKITEITGSSPDSQEQAIRNAIRRTAKNVQELQWFEVTESRGYIENGDVAYWQVTVKIGFTVKD